MRADRRRSLADAMVSEDNSFNLVRLGAAVAVLVSHSVALRCGDALSEPLSSATPYSLGQHAVNVFFVLSGLMLARSWSLRPDLLRFAAARLLRIYPGLLACGLVVAFVIAPFGTRDPAAYFAGADSWLYPIRVLWDFSRAGLDGVFVDGTINSGSINDSLWTIKYELAAYLVFIAAAAVGLVRRPAFAIALLGLSALAVVAIEAMDVEAHVPVLGPAGRFAMSFALGVAAFAFRARVPLAWPWLAALFVLAVALRGTPLVLPACILFTGYLALYLGSARPHGALAWTQRHDLSYGVYLYAWPVQQLILFRFASIGLIPHIAASLAFAAVLAFWSWRFVERPALRAKPGAASWRARSGRAYKSAQGASAHRDGGPISNGEGCSTAAP